MMKKLTYLFLLFALISSGCRKFLEVDNPIDKAVANYVYNSETSAIAVVTGLYYNMQMLYAQGDGGISIICSVMGDELEAISQSNLYGAYLNQAGSGIFWAQLYQDIYKCNAAIEGLEDSEKLATAVRSQLLGESKFTRAFLYFYLVNLFGDVPLITSTNYAENSKLLRSSKSKVYEQIARDLQEAIALLNVNYVAEDVRTPTMEKIRPNKAAAQALLARVYLYMGQWAEAEATATLLINNPAYEISKDLDNVFLKNSREAIWQMQPLRRIQFNNYINTADAVFMVLDAQPHNTLRPVWISSYLESAFESGDLRYERWVGKTNFKDDQNIPLNTQYRFAYKYKRNKSSDAREEYLMVLRIAEQYLIRAEAKINNGNIASGIEDLNVLRSKRSIGDLDTPDGLAKLSTGLNLELAKLAVEHERQVELFTEWGHRWLDLKRTRRVDEVMSNLNPIKAQGWFWQTYRQLLPTPESDRRLNPNLGQTPGYPN